MHLLLRENKQFIQILVNDFIGLNVVDSKESIPLEFLKFLRKADIKIEDGVLLNELWDLIEQKIFPNG